jgi:signal transduction histidine kinase
MRPAEYLAGRGPLLVAAGFALVLLLGFFDYLTGVELSFSIFYVLPIMLVAWFGSSRAAVAISLFGALVWHLADVAAGHAYSQSFMPYWNTSVRLGFFLIVGTMLSRLRAAYDEKKRLVGELTDTLERLKAAQDELEKKAAELGRSNAELERFAYVAAHDLKSPLVAVEGYVMRLKKHFRARWDERAEEYAHEAVEVIQRMSLLIEDLLEYARSGSGGGRVQQVDCDVLVERALKNLAALIGQSGAIVTRDPLPPVLADPGRLVQVFQNLIANAVKFRGSEPPRIHVSVDSGEGEWVFSVRDNGIGIDPRDSARIFELFERLEGSGRPGTGIGLAVCKKVVERHGGRIWVQSALSKGSTVFFTIPKVI